MSTSPMNIDRHTIGRTAGHDGQGPAPVDQFRMTAGGGFSVVVWTYGATLVELHVPDRDGLAASVVTRLPSVEAYERRDRNPAYMGATMGRFARCVAHARFVLDGRAIALTANDGRHHFHGGRNGFDRYVWNAEAGRDGDELAVRMSLDRPDGDEGYPGDVHAEAIYRLRADGRFTIDYLATVAASTIVSLANHSFWNLGGHGAIDRHRLRINAARVLAIDADLVPVGAPVPVADTPLDFRTRRAIDATRLDHCYALDDPSWCLELDAPATGRRMRVVTTAPGLQMYTGEALASPRAGLCFQTGAWPDAPNHPDYPPVRLDPGATYRQRTEHFFTIDPDLDCT